MGSVFRELVIDCNDPERVARFWSEVLGWRMNPPEEGFFWLSSTGDDSAPEPLLIFAPVPETKTVKNRLHIDVNPTGVDQPAELERLLALGAKPENVGQGDVSWVVLADPEGNEFCLLKRRLDQPD
jgi:predicted enzyme related to lactoylglutathione lyase